MRDEFKSYCHEGNSTTTIINNAGALSKKLALEAFTNMRNLIQQGEPLKKDDCTDTGNKYTTCTWGMCTDSSKVYPKPEMHSFPQDFVDDAYVSALEFPKGQHCPMRVVDPEAADETPLFGCYYECRIFGSHRRNPTRAEAVDMYNAAITKLEETDG